MLGSRGCYHSSCRYCCIAAFHANKRGKKYVLRSAHSIIEEMSFLRKQGIKIFFFHDDNFFLATEEENIKRFSEIKSEMDANHLKDVRLYIKSRPSTITGQTIAALQSLGVGGLFIGIENNAENDSRYLGRNETSQDREKALNLLKKAGFFVSYNLLLFNPQSTPEEIQNNFEFIENILDTPFNFGRVEIYAGTPLEKDLYEQGKLLGSYLAWDYKINDLRIERMVRWCQTLFKKRRFDYRGLINQNITLGYHADMMKYFFPGPTAEILKNKVHTICRLINLNTLQYLKELFCFAMSKNLKEESCKEFLENISSRIKKDDERLLNDLLELRKLLDLYSHICSWADRLRLGSSQEVKGLFFRRLLGNLGPD